MSNYIIVNRIMSKIAEVHAFVGYGSMEEKAENDEMANARDGTEVDT